MLSIKLKPHIILSLIALLFIALTAVFLGSAKADNGSIAIVKMFPEKGGTYEVVDNVLYQITRVNTNTTLSVSIDGELPISMVYQGIKNETLQNSAAPLAWYTWQITIPPISAQGNHSFQFFSHYYVWQDKDNYWSEFNSYSTKEYFSITGHLQPVSETEITTKATDLVNTYVMIELTTPIPALLLIRPFWRRVRSQKAHTSLELS